MCVYIVVPCWVCFRKTMQQGGPLLLPRAQPHALSLSSCPAARSAGDWVLLQYDRTFDPERTLAPARILTFVEVSWAQQGLGSVAACMDACPPPCWQTALCGHMLQGLQPAGRMKPPCLGCAELPSRFACPIILRFCS